MNYSTFVFDISQYIQGQRLKTTEEAVSYVDTLPIGHALLEGIGITAPSL